MKLERLMGLSEYAKSRKARGLPGGTLQAVLNACNDGRISFVKAGRNRMVDPMAADRQWLNNTDPTRYGADAYAAALGIETPPPPPAAGADPARAIGQAEALAVCFENLPLAAGILVHELNMEPLPALRAAVSAVSTLCLAVAEVLACDLYQDTAVPGWALPLIEGTTDDPELTKALDNVAWFAAELSRPEAAAPDEIDDLTAELRALGIH